MNKTCEVEGCTGPAKARGKCGKHYDMWRQGRLEGFPPFKATRKRKKASAWAIVPAKQPSKQEPRRSAKPETVTSIAEFRFRVDLTLYPKLRDCVVKTADKFLVTPEHVMISLMGEGLAARQKEA